LHNNFRSGSHTPYGPPTSVTRLQLRAGRPILRTSTALPAETHWFTRTRLGALSRLVTST